MDEQEHAVIDSNSSEDLSQKRYKITTAIEIPLLLIMVGSAISGAPFANLILYRTCVHQLDRSPLECRPFLSPDKANYTPDEKNHMQELEKEVQEYANVVNTIKDVLGAVVPAVLSLFIGVWSDKHGRKPLITWSLLGMTLNSMLVVVFSIAQGLGPWWLILGTFFSLCGGFSVMIIGALCYITDATNDDNRTFRLVLLQMVFAVGMAGGGLLSPYLLGAVGNVYLFFIVAFLHTCAYVFAALVLEESLMNVVTGSIFTVLNVSHLKEMFRECFKKRANYGRSKLLLTIAATALATFTLYGASSLIYLYTRNKLQWTMKDFTTFSAIGTVWVMGGFFGVALIQKFLHISDLSFAAIAMVSCIAESIIKALATTSWHMYLGSAVSFFGSVSGPLTRSFLTKTLPSQDIGKAFGLLGSAESFCPLIAPLVYNALYAFTLSSFPSAFLVLTAGIYSVSLVCILIVKYLVIRSPSVSYQLIDDAPIN
ncbi:hypothetical protein ABMA27_006172 [Loxostege sticticalis]|uniref:Proton-coupled folate transporter n=1 Tax=Loxostege sticticalis TaxID=481309 RepID=A0ABR3HHU8_LOXSC